jgi:hypothetical protein
MKKIIITLFITTFLSQIIFAQDNPSNIDLSSVDLFFNIKKGLEVGMTPSDAEWETLLESKGYSIRMTTKESKERLKRIIIIAFSPKLKQQQDSILKISITDNMDDWDKVASKLMMDNFLDMKENMVRLEDFRNNYDFNVLIQKSKERLKSFLKNPIDSLIVFPSVNLLCQEPDAQSKPKGIVIDFNLFYKQELTNDNVNFLAHEMFHTYRRNFTNKQFIQSYQLIRQIDKLEDEGVANMIDKTIASLLHKLKIMGYPQSLINLYDTEYKNTPQKLQTVDSITCSFIDKKISKEEFDKQMKGFFLFGGHPNSLYMTDVIQKAELKNELLDNFYNPVKFVEIYH